MKAARRPGLTECSDNGARLHFLEGVRNLYLWLFFSREASGEQKMKLSPADKTYVSDADTLVVMRRGGLPGSCETSDDTYRRG